MKKVLAWAVALALVLSSFTMAFAANPAASDFSDYDSIQYKEAVDVMVATGVINGYPDGTFGPTKDVKRSESAKMIAVMLNGGKDIGDEYKGSCTFADSKDHWAAGYIAYCSATQPVIINGRSADVFDPEGNVTGTELAKMALCALGYDPQIQGYTGDQWAASVLRDANKVGLFEGLADDFVPGEPCSREETAQILFNCLKGTMVEYDTTTSVTVGDATVTVNSKVQDQKWPNADSPFYPMNPNQKDDNRDGLKQLYESVFDGKLGQTGTDEDESGRPAHEWEFDDESVGIYPDTPDYDFFAEDSTSVAKAVKAYDESLYKDFTKRNNTKDLSSIYVNGEYCYADFDDLIDDYYDDIVVAKGDRIELFKLGSENGVDYYRAVITQYAPVTISAVETDLDEEDKDDGHSALLTLKVYFWDNTTSQLNTYEEDFFDDEIPGYDADTYVEDAVLAVAISYDNYGSILDSYVMEELASGTVTKVKGSNITIDGEVYELSEYYAPIDGVKISSKKEYTLYDYNGFALASEQVVEDADIYYGIVIKTSHQVDEWEVATDKVKIFTEEGDTTPYTLADECVKHFALVGATTLNPNDLVAYTLDEDGNINEFWQIEDLTQPKEGKGVKTGNLLYGNQLVDEVVAFANIADEGEDAVWKVYDLDDLKDADTVTVFAWDKVTNKDGIPAMKIGSLEPVTIELGFVTGIEPFENEDGDQAFDITGYVDGKEVTYTTKKNVIFDNYQNGDIVLAKFTLDGDFVKAVELADCNGVDEPTNDFAGYDAVFFGAGNYVIPQGPEEPGGIKTVVAKEGNMLTFGEGEATVAQIIDGSANIYAVSFGEQRLVLEKAKNGLKDIQVGSHVILMQLDEESDAWDTVILIEKIPS
jgi:hypothetical protein